MIIVTKQSIKRKYSSQSIRQLVNKKKQRRMSPSFFVIFNGLHKQQNGRKSKEFMVEILGKDRKIEIWICLILFGLRCHVPWKL
jgi:hypothetical protein